jgi:hypothetical protein
MKTRVLLLFMMAVACAPYHPVYAQTTDNSQKIKWYGVQPITVNGVQIDNRKTLVGDEVHLVQNDAFMPYIQLRYEGYSTEVTVSDASYLPLSEQENTALQPDLAKSKLQPIYQYGKERNRTISFCLYPAIRRTASGYEKLVSFSYRFVPSGSDYPDQPRVVSGRIKAGSSIFASGDVYRIAVPKEGIYRIDAGFLSSIGVPVQSINPRNLSLYGNGGTMLPQANSAFRIEGVYENQIYASGEQDGVLDPQDYFLFYARGTILYQFNPANGLFGRTRNVYTDTAYYFIKINNTPGKRITTATALPQSTSVFSEFDDRLLHESEQVNYIRSGRFWTGESFSFTPSRSFTFSAPGIVQGSTIRVTSSVTLSSPGPESAISSFTLQAGNSILGTQSLSGYNLVVNPYGIKARNSIVTYNFNQSTLGSNSVIPFTMSFNKGPSADALGNLDYLLVNVRRILSLYGSSTPFRVTSSTLAPTATYRVSGMNPSAMVWDVTDPLEPVMMPLTFAGSVAEFTANSDTLKEFIALSAQGHPSPVFVNRVKNQNIRSLQPTQLVILAPSVFLNDAIAYANYRANASGITTQVVDIHDIYMEFSSGGQDVTALRDFLRMLYKKPNSSLQHVLMYGDATFDYKNITPGNTNFVPIYQSVESFNDIASYCMDDFFVCLDDNEGEWREAGSLDVNLLDIGVGRFPIRSSAEAGVALAKVQLYESQAALGNWRNRITLMADHKHEDGHFHLDESERIGRLIEGLDSTLIMNKIYLDAFAQIATPNGVLSPDATNEVRNAAIQGSLITQYYGHGNTSQLSARRMVNTDLIQTWPTYDNLSFWVTATCDFGKCDDPGLTSGSEALFHKPASGAIALFTTTRPVYTTTNSAQLNEFYRAQFDYSQGILDIGEVYKRTKNRSFTGVLGRSLLILGDPSMFLAIPKEVMVITSIKRPDSTHIDTLKALSVVTLSGEVRSRSTGQRIQSFNGRANIIVFDAPSVITSKGEGLINPQGLPLTRVFSQWSNFVFNGQATIVQGAFNVQFVVPLQISYSNIPGKISLYGRQFTSQVDASGFRNNIPISGSDTGVVLNNEPPLIRLFMDDETFVSGGTTSNSPKMLARLLDDQGIAIGSTPGQQIECIINKKEPLIMNEYYLSKENNFREGSIEYPLKDLEAGNYTLTLKARDTHNNPAEATIEFVVADKSNLTLNNIFNYPNPFSDFTLFHFDHNKAGEDVEVMVQIFTVSGNLIKTLSGFYPSSKTRISDLAWNARDDFGDKLAKGVYIYKLSVRTPTDKKQEFQKLVILN